mmetsp:Transcript_8467/g.19207  ORF Transcript_8467/g.19207 Transcript_8467/m.19207 type:complete len:301 (+) Transcript_8467:256-1158(+)
MKAPSSSLVVTLWLLPCLALALKQQQHISHNGHSPHHHRRHHRFLQDDANATASQDDSDSTPFRHFVAHNKTMTCSADEHARPFNNQIRGVNLGGWMVLEPWITPSLFYQFLSGRENSTAFDTYTFCEVLGAEEANKQLRNHWDRWVTEEIIQTLAASGAVNSLRLPVGDYMYQPYGPYVGCFDGALDYVDNLLDWAYSSGLTVLFDIHTMKDSQNGFDNSGQALGFQWTSALRCVRACGVKGEEPFGSVDTHSSFVVAFCFASFCFVVVVAHHQTQCRIRGSNFLSTLAHSRCPLDGGV